MMSKTSEFVETGFRSLSGGISALPKTALKSADFEGAKTFTPRAHEQFKTALFGRTAQNESAVKVKQSTLQMVQMKTNTRG